MRTIDITPLISERLGVFPGDQKFSRKIALSQNQGHNIDLSAIETTVHLGAHTDAPNHYSKNGVGMAARDLSFYLGRCLVLHANVPRGERVGMKHLASKWHAVKEWGAKRILVRTGSFPNPERWNSDFASLDPELIEIWARAGVRLVGLDTPSIDPETSKDLPAHQTVARNDMAILEGVVLDEVDEGYFTLIALPLKIQNADASPVRAVLISPPLSGIDDGAD